MKYTGLFIADLHIGDIPLSQLRYEVTEILYPYIERTKPDFLIFGGDYFGHKMYVNDPNASFAWEVLHTIDRILPEDSKIRMVYGTKSHDEDQYDSFEILKDHRDFRVIKHVAREELFPGMNVLYLPEEMLIDPEDYYKEFFEGEESFSFIFGHGIIKEMMPKAASVIEDKKNVKRRVPVFRSGDLERICSGLTLFGHYHIHQIIGDRVMYAGSFSRWKFGEEEPKGFLEITFDSDEEECDYTFIENTCAEKYITIGFGYKDTIFSSLDEMQKKMDTFEKLAGTNNFDHLKLEFNIPETCENPEFYIEYLRERFKRSSHIKTNIINGYIAKKHEEAKKEVDADYEKYAPIFDPNTSIEDQVSYFIDVEYHRPISSQTAALYMYHDLNEILAQEQE